MKVLTINKRKTGLAIIMVGLMILIIGLGNYFEEKLKIATLTQNNIGSFKTYKIEEKITYGLPESWISSETKVSNKKIKYHSDFISDDNIIKGYIELWDENEDIQSIIKENEKHIKGIGIDDYKIVKSNIGKDEAYVMQYNISLSKDDFYRTYDYFLNLNGNKIKHTVKGIMHRIAVTAFPESTQSYILLSCMETERPVYQQLFDQLKTASVDKIKFYMSMVLPLYSENMVLSSGLWNSWNEETQTAYTFYSNLNGPNAVVYGKCIGMGIRNAAKSKPEFDYSKRGEIDLFS
ncbi:hypothetical protein [Clostridium sp. UBA6640]|uniref:hypothetical protein n=1 Tax=Clostridium sp. UBA6640 TaxID=1946370 RepID=UPI0025B931AF|nr:hypothetical protein [Clostridium sp. UBA6640]